MDQQQSKPSPPVGAIGELRPEPRPARRAALLDGEAPVAAPASNPPVAPAATASAPRVAPAATASVPPPVGLPSPASLDAPLRPRVISDAPRLRPSVKVQGSTVARFGDRAGEYIRMERGRFDAWIHVVIAYLMESALIGLAPALGLIYLLSAVSVAPSTASAIGGLVGALGGGALAWLVFRDRWRCIEAYSSRFCSGVANLSVLYVPIVALIYANLRGLAKRRGE
jgi:hypothetical protein